eukprot:gnl/MRDRNA2_/MRDRNA2_85205_c0_seq7.p1 gnl/MRDRNA2_/MRDRNA2_85205_c0~~gnl/MRDRNA2_/MRDRNA2_85205_c0_seq7.p1  ORF type:complete len:326 (+),score=43.19 gnl/MRDRNA2_/MRDRNA2_85205_c0_seq7:77-1054(+)
MRFFMTSSSAMALIPCMIVTGDGLRVGISSSFDPFQSAHRKNQNVSQDMQKHKPPAVHQKNLKVAFCLAGQARTLPDKAVRASLLSFVEKQRQTHHMDVFAALTIPGTGPDDWSTQPQVNASESAVKEILEELNAKDYFLSHEEGNVNEQNVDQFLIERKCHQQGFWSKLEHLVRNINELEHMRSSLRQMKNHEAKNGFKYDVVLIARPDLLYQKECHLDFARIKERDFVLFDHLETTACSFDWFFAAERKRMMGLFQHPLQCFNKPSPPYRDVLPQSAEAMIHHLLGISDAGGTVGTVCNVALQRQSGHQACGPFLIENEGTNE